MSNETEVAVDVDSFGKPQEIRHEVVVMYHDNGEPKAGFKVVDANHPLYREAKRNFDVANVKRSAARRKNLDAKTDEGANVLLDISEEQKRALAVACVVDWFGFGSKGKPVPVTPQLVEAAFKTYPAWIDLVSAKVEEGARFLASSQINSSSSPGTSST